MSNQKTFDFAEGKSLEKRISDLEKISRGQFSVINRKLDTLLKNGDNKSRSKQVNIAEYLKSNDSFKDMFDLMQNRFMAFDLFYPVNYQRISDEELIFYLVFDTRRFWNYPDVKITDYGRYLWDTEILCCSYGHPFSTSDLIVNATDAIKCLNINLSAGGPDIVRVRLQYTDETESTAATWMSELYKTMDMVNRKMDIEYICGKGEE